MKLIKLKTDLIKAIEFDKRLGFVPKMGSLHEGHNTLIKTSQKKCKKTLVSIFVNPKQFNKKKDFLKELLENNVLFEDPIKAHIHLKNIWMDPLEWWNSEKIIEIKKRFHDLCFIKNDDYLNTWKNYFISELKK